MTLHALSPLDGRYAQDVSPLRDFFSEFAFLRTRTQVELQFLSALSGTGLLRDAGLSQDQPDLGDFTEDDARRIQEYETITRHDIKAIEYFLRDKLPPAFHQYLHFGLTSEDVNNIAQAILLRDSRDQVLLPALDHLLTCVQDFAKKYRLLPFLARTHGQPAVPTTLGKEFAVYWMRLMKCREEISNHIFEAKLTGAVGNFNSWRVSAPEVDWMRFSEEFLQRLGLKPNLLTTQILPYDDWVRYFDAIRMTNSILIDYAQDIWRYISDGMLKQKIVDREVGSSTMPQKVNPIDFENAEGNLGVANALLTHYGQKLPVSRLQRDLSDSTVRRTFGVALGHSLLAWNNIRRGMSRVEADEQRIRQELNSHWEVVSEGAQMVLRAAGRSDAYETLKTHTRGLELDEKSYRSWVGSLDINEETREQLLGLSPETYIGLAIQLTDEVLRSSDLDR